MAVMLGSKHAVCLPRSFQALRPNSGQTRNDLTPRNYEMYRFLKALIQ